MMSFFKKKEKEVKVDNSRFDGKIYKGIWLIGDKEVIGAYKRDGNNNFVTDRGIYNVPKGTKKTQLKRLNDAEMVALGVDVKAINQNLIALELDHCAPHIFSL